MVPYLAMASNDEQRELGRLPGVGEIIDDRYRLDGLIASGGMGIVLQGRQLTMDRDVAIKLLHPHVLDDPESIARFQREVDLAKDLQHPHTIQLYDFGRTDDGVLYIVMEYLQGRDLKELIAEEGPLSIGRTVEILRQTLDGLAEAHAAGIVHRDLKPSNIFIERDRRGRDLAKVLDFGIARSLDTASDLTGTNQVCGTAHYMAPEAVMQRDTGKVGDVYATGLIAVEMLVGKRLFDAESVPRTILLQLEHEVPIPEPLQGTDLGRVLRTATAKHPDDRYRNADHMLDALEAVGEGPTPTVRPGSDSIPPIELPSDSKVFSRLADGLEDQSVDALRRDEHTDAPRDTHRPNRAPREESTAGTPTSDRSMERVDEPSSAPTPAPTRSENDIESGDDLRARSQKELVGGVAGTLNEGAEASILWTLLGLAGIAIAVAVFYYAFLPGGQFNWEAWKSNGVERTAAGTSGADAGNTSERTARDDGPADRPDGGR